MKIVPGRKYLTKGRSTVNALRCYGDYMVHCVTCDRCRHEMIVPKSHLIEEVPE